jgi:hypothetical protein
MRFPELGIYLLPGHSDRPADLLDEVRAAEALGLGSAWISERFDVKEVGALSGAAAAVTNEIWIGSGVTNVDTRHPLLLASLATLARLHAQFHESRRSAPAALLERPHEMAGPGRAFRENPIVDRAAQASRAARPLGRAVAAHGIG